MNPIYMDYACTSFPKPECVIQAVTDYMTRIGSNVSRSSYGSAYEAEEIVYETRALLCELFHGPDPRNVIFTKNITESLNVLLKGILKSGDHALVSAMEHNAVMRPLNQIARELPAGEQPRTETDITYTRIPCDRAGFLQTDQMQKLCLPNTRAVILMTASNVSGTLMPIEAVGSFCKKNGLLLIVDTAQTAGAIAIDMEKCGIDALAFTGHKGLLGPQGTGGFIASDTLAQKMKPLLTGGTGSFSHLESVPAILPDRFEAGTLNLPGIAGLGAALRFLKNRGMDTILAHERRLTQLFLDAIKPLADGNVFHIAGPENACERAAVVSLAMDDMDPSQVAFRLEQDYRILTRVGLHCAPSAHKCLGTYPTGTIRFSFGWATAEDEVINAAEALSVICETRE